MTKTLDMAPKFVESGRLLRDELQDDELDVVNGGDALRTIDAYNPFAYLRAALGGAKPGC